MPVGGRTGGEEAEEVLLISMEVGRERERESESERESATHLGDLLQGLAKVVITDDGEAKECVEDDNKVDNDAPPLVRRRAAGAPAEALLVCRAALAVAHYGTSDTNVATCYLTGRLGRVGTEEDSGTECQCLHTNTNNSNACMARDLQQTTLCPNNTVSNDILRNDILGAALLRWRYCCC